MNDYKCLGILTSNQMVIDDLRWDFSKIHFWDTPVSACQIIGERISAISAMYCTAANELLFLGLPLNSVAVKAHVAREFSWAPAGRQEFREIVHQVNSQAAFQDADRITKFGFMNLLKREAKSRILQALPHNE